MDESKALLKELEQIADVACEDKQAIICLVGEDIHGKPGIAASVFSTIADAGVNIRMISQGASEINISFVVDEKDVPKAVRRLHGHFFPAVTTRKVRAHKKNGLGRVRVNGSAAGGGRRRGTYVPATVELRASRP